MEKMDSWNFPKWLFQNRDHHFQENDVEFFYQVSQFKSFNSLGIGSMSLKQPEYIPYVEVF